LQKYDFSRPFLCGVARLIFESYRIG